MVVLGYSERVNKMKQTISKCDKCKKQADILIDVSMVNTYQEVDEPKKYQSNEAKSVFSSGLSFFGSIKGHPTIKAELCEDCTHVLLHWLGHPENDFIRLQVNNND